MGKFLRLIPAGSVFTLIAALAAAAAEEQKLETAIFAGGCFWCVEADFDPVPGVVETVSGYIGGTTPNPTYDDVSWGNTGHYEAVRITFDASQVSYHELLRVFWRSIDPTDGGGQFCDRGPSYKTAVFATSEAQLEEAEASKAELEASNVLGDDVETEIFEAPTFYPAEDYHQDYYTKHPLQYGFYRFNCGRDRRIEELWGEEAWGGYSQG